MDEFDTLLLSAVYREDINSLKTQLLTVLDPNIYLNRIYDESDEQKCTLLMIACLAGYNGVVYMLLDCFKPDLEVLNTIRITNNDQFSAMYQDVTILWAAAAMDNFLIVKRLVDHGARINHTTNTNSTALRCACYNGNVDMARYLVENGADLHITKQKNDTNLSLSAYCKHLQMTTYLIDELSCDVNECDTDGRSPLYFAVKCESFDVVQLLLNRGARNFPASRNQMSPIMLAAEKRCSDIVNAIAPYCSTLEQIEAEELLGSAFACAEHGPCDLQKSFQYFYQAIENRSIYNLPKSLRQTTSQVFDNRQECQTIVQLEELRLNPENMYTEALLVRERLLGPTNKKYHYSLIYRGGILADNDQFHRTIVLWLYELKLSQQYSISVYPDDTRRFVTIFSEMIVKSSPIPIEALLTIAATIVEQIKHDAIYIDDNLHTLLFLITIASQPSIDVLFSTADRKAFYRLLHSINKGRYVTRHYGSSLLHLSLSDLISASDDLINHICRYPCLRTVRTILQCGADVNATDAAGNTPLHIFASNCTICDENILQLLYDVDAHPDYINALGETPIDIAPNLHTKQLLQARTKISLKCLCARLIQKNNIVVQGVISTSLVNFIEKH